MDSRPIGVFDSGVGGLTVVKEIIRELPNERIVYFGDTARVPYGSKSKETVTKYSNQIVSFLLTHNVKLIVIACGTVSSNSVDDLRINFDLPFIDVITPCISNCLNTTKNNRIGVIGTERTISSGTYERLLKNKNPEVTVYSKACPLFVPLVEEGFIDNNVADMVARIYLQELLDAEVDTLVFGCTHYPLLTECISKMNNRMSIINPAVYCAENVKQYLMENRMLNDGYKPHRHSFFVSDVTAKFNMISKLLLDDDFYAEQSLIKVDLEE